MSFYCSSPSPSLVQTNSLATVFTFALKYGVWNFSLSLSNLSASAIYPAKIAMSKKSPSSVTPASFENAMAELAELVSQMESGQLALEASVAAYQRGSELIQYCAAQLEKVEQQVKILDAGMMKPFLSQDEGDSA